MPEHGPCSGTTPARREVTADLDGDGKPDLAGSDGSKINVLLNNGTPFSTRTTYAVTSRAG